MKKFTKAFFSLAICAFTLEASAQDFHFSQFFNSPLTLNPANAGAFNGDMRGIINYKNQWQSVSSNSFKTYAGSFDMRAMQKKWKHGYLGIGVSFFNDQAGAAKMGTTSGNISIASSRDIDANNSIMVGLQGGFAQRSMNTNDLKWDQQYQNGAYNGALASGEPVGSNFNYGDFAAGIGYNYGKPATSNANNSLKVKAGFSVYHINQPNQSFYPGDKDKLYMKYIGHANVYWGILNTSITIAPGFMYAMQGPSQELLAGGAIRYTLSQNSRYTGNVKESALSLGGYVRAKDAFIAYAELEFANYAVAMSYDVNVSTLRTASSGLGGLELCLKYINPNPFRNKSSARF